MHTAYPPSRLSSLTNFVHHLGKCTDTLINHQCTLGQTSLIFTPTITVAFAAHHLLLCCAPFHLLVRTKTSSGAQHHQQGFHFEAFNHRILHQSPHKGSDPSDTVRMTQLAPKGQTLPYMFYCICLPHIHLRGNSTARQHHHQPHCISQHHFSILSKTSTTLHGYNHFVYSVYFVVQITIRSHQHLCMFLTQRRRVRREFCGCLRQRLRSIIVRWDKSILL